MNKLLKFFVLAAVITLLVYLSLNDPPPKHRAPIPEDQYLLISPVTYKYILNQPELCLKRNLFLVLMIPVTLQNSEVRDAIRKTWGQLNLVPQVDIARVFFIGKPAENNPKLQEDLRAESQAHGDIVQMDFLDSYNNLTIKTMMIMNWLTTYCSSTQFGMKVDSDVFLNVPFLVRYLQSKAYKKDYFTGAVIRNGRPRRMKDSKWYLSEELYPENWFPPYTSGAGYVFTIHLAEKIIQASRFVRLIPLEDLYVGLCLDYLGVRPAYAWKLLPYRNLFESRHLEYDRCTYARQILIMNFTPLELKRIWTDFQSSSDLCWFT